jgi:hypothetical protein
VAAIHRVQRKGGNALKRHVIICVLLLGLVHSAGRAAGPGYLSDVFPPVDQASQLPTPFTPLPKEKRTAARPPACCFDQKRHAAKDFQRKALTPKSRITKNRARERLIQSEKERKRSERTRRYLRNSAGLDPFL